MGLATDPSRGASAMFGRALAIARGLRAAHSNPEVETTSARLVLANAVVFTLSGETGNGLQFRDSAGVLQRCVGIGGPMRFT